MKPNEAFNTVRGVCDAVRCTKQERNTIDEALGVIAVAIQSKPKKEEKKADAK